MGSSIPTDSATSRYALGVIMILHLGVVDIPYHDSSETKTTGDVAQKLENKYNVMGVFVDQQAEFILDEIMDSLVSSFENEQMGLSVDNPIAQAEEEIKARFNKYIDLQEHGIHTKAKVSLRKKQRKGRNKEDQVSFVDTGLYRQSFKCWAD